MKTSVRMKTHIKLWPLLIAATVVSCTNKEMSDFESASSIQFKATIDDALRTRTVFDGSNLVWSEGDQLNVFTENNNERYSLVSGAGTPVAGFSGAEVSGSEYYALYPYDAEASLNQGKIITSFPSVQVARENGISDGTNLSVACSSTASLSFRNVGSLVKFQITSENVGEVVITGNNSEVLAGKITIDWNGGEPVCTVSSDPQPSVSVKPAVSGSAFTPGVYYAAVLPTVFQKGITVTFKPLVSSTGNGVGYCNVPEDMVKSGSSEMNMKRSHIQVIGDIDGGRLWSFSNVEVNALRGKANNKGIYIDLRNGRTFSPINAYKHGGDIQMCFVQSNVRALGMVSCSGANLSAFVNMTNLQKFNDNYQTASDADLLANWPAAGQCGFVWLDSDEMDDEKYNSLTLTGEIMNLCTKTLLNTTVKDLGSSGNTTDQWQMTPANLADGSRKYLLFVTRKDGADDYFGIIRFTSYSNDANYPKAWFDYKVGRAPNSSPIGNVPTESDLEHDQIPVSEVVGVTTCAGQYALTEEPCLIEGAKKIQELGTKNIKIWFEHAGRQYPYHSDWPENIENYSSLQLAKTPYFRQVFQMPFKTYSLEFNDATVNWRDGLSESEKTKVFNNLYSLAVHLLSEYKGTGKTFIIQNWEGDGHLNRSSLSNEQLPVAIQGMIDWANTRQDAITRARKDIGCDGVVVVNAFEFNYVLITNMPEPFVIDCVVPYTHCDLYSYSSYSSGRSEASLDGIYDRIEYIRSKTPASKLYGQHNLMIGEFGYDERRVPGQGYTATIGSQSEAFQKMMVQQQLERLLSLNLTYVFYWQLYCNGAIDDNGNTVSTSPDPSTMRDTNHCKGFWLIRPDGSLTLTWNYFKSLFEENANVSAKRPEF